MFLISLPSGAGALPMKRKKKFALKIRRRCGQKKMNSLQFIKQIDELLMLTFSRSIAMQCCRSTKR